MFALFNLGTEDFGEPGPEAGHLVSAGQSLRRAAQGGRLAHRTARRANAQGLLLRTGGADHQHAGVEKYGAKEEDRTRQ